MHDNKHHRRDDNRETGPLIWVDSAAAAGQLDNAMIDIETLGKKPGAAVLSIGAVMFGAAGLGEAFYTPVSLQSCTDVGLTIDPDTVAWWVKQSDEARQAAFRADAPALAVALQRFTDWFVAQKARYPWCHGATFDVPILDAAYEACGLQAPWKFYDVRDTRTLYDLAGVKVDRSKGTHHNALDDARTQAEAAVTALNILNPEGGRFAWAALAENGNVIIWSGRRDQVEPVAAKYSRPVVPVVVLPHESISQPAGVLQALRDGIPLQEPVHIGKALRAQREARVVLSGGTGPVAAVHLVNIGLTGWIYTKETAEAYAKGYNTALQQYRGALLEIAEQKESTE